MSELKLDLEKREQISKTARKEAVAERKVLGNVFGGEKSIAVQGTYRDFYHVVKEAGKNHPVKLNINGETEVSAMIRDIEFDTLTQNLHHVTFKVIKQGEKVHAEVPVHIIGDAPGVKTGLVLVHIVHSIEVETMPTSIPESFDVDVSNLNEDGDGVRLSEISIPSNVELLIEDPDALLVKLEVPRAQIEAEEEAAEAAEAAAEAGEEAAEGGTAEAGEAGEAAPAEEEAKE